jgi:hypothetical protein
VCRQVKRTWDIFPLKGQGTSSLKYINCGICINLEREVCPLKGNWVSIDIVNKLLSTGQILGANTHKKCYYVGNLKDIVLWSLAFSVKAQKTNFYFWPIKLLEPFVFLTDSYSVKRPLSYVWCETPLTLCMLRLLCEHWVYDGSAFSPTCQLNELNIACISQTNLTCVAYKPKESHYQFTTKVKSSISVKISSFSHLETRFLLTKNTHMK